MEDNRRKLYDALTEDYDMGSFEQFCNDVADDTKRRKLYDAIINDYDLGDFDSFSNQLGVTKPAAPAPTPTAKSVAEAPTQQEAPVNTPPVAENTELKTPETPQKPVNLGGPKEHNLVDANPNVPTQEPNQWQKAVGAGVEHFEEDRKQREQNKEEAFEQYVANGGPSDMLKRVQKAGNDFKKAADQATDLKGKFEEQGFDGDYRSTMSRMEKLGKEIAELKKIQSSSEAKKKLEEKKAEYEKLGKLLDKNPEYLAMLDRDNKELDKLSGELNDTFRELAANGGIGKTYGDGVYSTYHRSEDALNIDAARNLVDDAKRQLLMPMKYDNSKGWNNFWQGTWEDIKNPDWWTFGIQNFHDNVQIFNLMKKFEDLGTTIGDADVDLDIDDQGRIYRVIGPNGEREYMSASITPAEQELLKAYLSVMSARAKRAYDMSDAYKSGEMFGDSIKFMIEMMLTRGGAKVIGGGVTRFVEKLADKWGIKWLMKGAEEFSATAIKDAFAEGTMKGVGKLATETLRATGIGAIKTLPRDVVNSAVFGIVNPLFLSEIGTQMTTLDDSGHTRGWGQIFSNAAYNSFKEYFTEQRGEQFARLTGIPLEYAAKRFLDSSARPLFKSMVTRFLDKTFEDVTMIQGFWETAEEVEGAAMDYLAGWATGNYIGSDDALYEFAEGFWNMEASFAPLFAFQFLTKAVGAGVSVPIQYKRAQSTMQKMKDWNANNNIGIPDIYFDRIAAKYAEKGFQFSLNDVKKDCQDILHMIHDSEGELLSPDKLQTAIAFMGDYIKAVAEDAAIDEYNDAINTRRRNETLADIRKNGIGDKQFYVENIGTDGNVDHSEDSQYNGDDQYGGKEVFVVNDDNGQMVGYLVGWDANGNATLVGTNGEFIPTDQQALNSMSIERYTLQDYLDGYANTKQAKEEHDKQVKKTAENVAPLIEQYNNEIGNNVEVTINGTPVSVSVNGADMSGLIAGMPDGTIQTIPWTSIAEGIVPKTETEMQQDAEDSLMLVENARKEDEAAIRARITGEPIAENGVKIVGVIASSIDPIEKMAVMLFRDDDGNIRKTPKVSYEDFINGTGETSNNEVESAETAAVEPVVDETPADPERIEVPQEPQEAPASPSYEIPVTEKGTPDYNRMLDENPSEFYTQFVLNGGSRDMAKDYLGKKKDEIEKALKDADPNTAMELTSKLNTLNEVISRVNGEAEQEASVAEQKAAEEAEAERKRQAELSEPKSARSSIAKSLNGYLKAIDPYDFMRELNWKWNDAKKFIAFFKKGGKTINRVAHEIWEENTDGMFGADGELVDTQQIRDIILDLFSGAQGVNDIVKLHEAENQQLLDEEAKLAEEMEAEEERAHIVAEEEAPAEPQNPVVKENLTTEPQAPVNEPVAESAPQSPVDTNTAVKENLNPAQEAPEAEKPQAPKNNDAAIADIDAEIAELEKQLMDKFNQLNSGIDPDALALTSKLVYLYIKKGMYVLEDIARTLISKYGDKVRNYIAMAYGNARKAYKDEGDMETVKKMASLEEIDDFVGATFELTNTNPLAVATNIENEKKVKEMVKTNPDIAKDAIAAAMGSNNATESKPAEKKEDDDKWQYTIEVEPNGHSTIKRTDVSGLIPIGDGRWRIEAKTPSELKGILNNPANNLSKIAEQLNDELDAIIKGYEPQPKAETKTIGTVKKDVDTRDNSELWVVTPSERVSKDEFDALKKKAKENNGSWSSFKKGFIFRSEDDANAFNGVDTPQEAETPSRTKKQVSMELSSLMDDFVKAAGSRGINVERMAVETDKDGKINVPFRSGTISGKLSFSEGRPDEVRVDAHESNVPDYDMGKIEGWVEKDGKAIADFIFGKESSSDNIEKPTKENNIKENSLPLGKEKSNENTDTDHERNDTSRLGQDNEGLRAGGRDTGSKRGSEGGNGSNLRDGGQEDGGTDGGRHQGSNGSTGLHTSGLHDSVEPSQKKNTRNNRDVGSEELFNASPEVRARFNIDAIKVIKALADESREATDEEKAILRKYTGWGGLGTIFNNRRSSEYQTLQTLLTPEEMYDAQLSINTAYYTPTAIINAMWNLAEKLGFKGGKVLEGSAGTGKIIGLMPEAISDRSDIQAIEIDSITGAILKALYPDADVHISGFQDVDIPNNSIDLEITNVPFGASIRVYDRIDKDLSSKFPAIHDFCIAKNVRKLKEGGIGIFISSNGTLDKSRKLRSWLDHEGKADVIGAFRLNNSTFPGTQTTSDIIVIRKRVNNEKSNAAIDVSGTTIVRSGEFKRRSERTNRVETARTVLEYNSYFVEHPEFMDGEMALGFEKEDVRGDGTSKAFRPESAGLYFVPDGISTDEKLDKWIDDLQSRIKSDKPATIINVAEQARNEAQSDKDLKEFENTKADTKEGQIVANSKGVICISRSGKAIPVDTNDRKVAGQSKATVVRDYDAIKKALNDVIVYQLENDSNDGLKALTDKLNKAYDSFVSKYGSLNKNRNLSWLRADVDFPATAAIENYREVTKNGKRVLETSKSDVFNRRVVNKSKESDIKDEKDGILASLNKFNRIDIGYIAKALNKPEDEVKEKALATGLAFEDPANGDILPSYEYLCGNVREKLAFAQDNNENGKYDSNIEALKKVIPNDIPSHLIDFQLGSSWLPVRLYNEYAQDRYGVTFEKDNFAVQRLGSLWVPQNKFAENNEKNKSEGVRSEMLDKWYYGTTLFFAALNNQTILAQVVRKHSDGTTETISDKEATQAIGIKIQDIKDDFRDWMQDYVQKNSEIAKELQYIYNNTFNAMAPKVIGDEFLPENLRFPGMAEVFESKPFRLRDFQAKAAIRAQSEPVLFAHEVGSGKTLTMISTAMEMRRLGNAKKPMIVVQNATVGQFVTSAKSAYPAAKILTVSDSDMGEEGRKIFYSKIKYNDWDIIIVPQSVFDMIPDSAERKTAFIQEQIDEIQEMIDRATSLSIKGGRVEDLKQQIKDLEDSLADAIVGNEPKKKKKNSKNDAVKLNNATVKAQEKLDRKVDSGVENFDELGIDAIIVDEAHNYKHLGFATSMGRNIKGVDPSFSKRAQGLYLKIQSVFDRCGHKNVVLATGTPISNTAAEVWTFMKYLMEPSVMQDNDLYYFDDFVNNFGNIAQTLEFSTSGSFKSVTRFVGYNNVPELARIWATTADVKLSKDLPQVAAALPDIEGGGAQDVFLPQSKQLRSVMAYVREHLRAFEKMSGKEKKQNSHIPLTMFGIAKRAAIDPRLVLKPETAIDEPESKTNKAVQFILDDLVATDAYKGACCVFCDKYKLTLDGKVAFNIFDDIKQKLMSAGVPEEKIAIITSGMPRSKKEAIFSAVNAGDIRVIMGSTETLGTGVNVQERMHLLIHMDAPDRPMDVTQRDAREVRQGNLHKVWGKTVRVIRFGVEDSLDVTAYQRLSTKDKFIQSMMDAASHLGNNTDNRSIDDEDEMGGSFDNPVAHLSGSEYALLKQKAERDLRKYRSKEQQHRAHQIYIENQTKKNRNTIEGLESQNEGYAKDIETIKKAFPNGTFETVTIEGKVCKTKEERAEALKELVNSKVRAEQDAALKDYSFQATGNRKEMHFDLKVDNVPVDVMVEISIRLVEQPDGGLMKAAPATVSYRCPDIAIDDYRQVPYGRVSSVIENIEVVITTESQRELIDENTAKIEQLNKDNALLEADRGKAFEYGDELAKAEKAVEEYTELMRKEMEEKEKKYAADDNSEDISSLADAIESSDEDDDTSEPSEEERRYSLVDDDELIEKLDKEPTVKVYRAMQLIDGELYPPMAAKKDGKYVDPIILGMWEKADEMLANWKEGDPLPKNVRYDKKSGKLQFKLDKGNGKYVWAAYNPYIHTSRTPLNDQFSSAQSRPELVTVEVEVPVSELTGEYTAKYAKDAVGEMDWKAGVVQGKLSGTRKVILSRYDKPIRIVPESEVADAIVKMFDGKQIEMPSNVVTPALRAELEKRGVPFIETDNQGNVLSDYDTKKENIKDAASKLAETLGVNIQFVDDLSHIKDTMPSHEKEARKAKGWFEPKTGKVYIVMPNIKNVAVAEATVLHEIVAHKGLRALFADEAEFNMVLDTIYENASDEIKAAIDRILAKGRTKTRQEATEEYLAKLAERLPIDEEEYTLWQKVRNWIIDALQRLGAKLQLTDQDLRALLFESYANLTGKRNFLENAQNLSLAETLRKMSYESHNGDSKGNNGRGGNSGGPISVSRSDKARLYAEIARKNADLLAKSKQIPEIGGAYTNNYFYLYRNEGNLNAHTVVAQFPLKGNRHLKQDILDFIEHDTEYAPKVLDLYFEEYGDGERRNLWDLVAIAQERGGAKGANLAHGAQSILASGRHNEEGNGNSSKTSGRFTDDDIRRIDADYLSAVESGDTDKAQKLVDEAATAWGALHYPTGQPILLYHGTHTGGFNTFDRASGFMWVTQDQAFANSYTYDETEAEEYEAAGYTTNNQVYKLYAQMLNTFDMGNIEYTCDSPAFETIAKNLGLSADELRQRAGVNKENTIYEMCYREGLADILNERGYDSIKCIEGFNLPRRYGRLLSPELANSVTYAVLNPSQLKSADAITRDDNGNVIPLSERFNEDDDDIRFSLLADEAETAFDEFPELSESIKDVDSVQGRWRESTVDETTPVRTIQLDVLKAEARKLGKSLKDLAVKAEEDVAKHLQRVNSQIGHVMDKFKGVTFPAFMDYVRNVMKDANMTMDEMTEYMALKNGLERQIVFAKRDAKKAVEAKREAAIKKENDEYNRDFERISYDTENALLTDEEREKAIKDLNELNQHHVDKLAEIAHTYDNEVERIERGDESQADYAKARKTDYGAIRTWFSKYVDKDGNELDYKPERPKGMTRQEYNAKLKKMSVIPDDVKEMADAEIKARARIAELEAKLGGTGVVSDLWAKVKEITNATVKMQLDHHMISRAMYESIVGNPAKGIAPMFDFYIPMRGFKDDTAQDLYDYLDSEQFSSYEKPFMRAEGRRTKPDNPFKYMYLQYQTAVFQGFKNDVKNTLYRFAVNHKNNGIITVSKAWYVKTGFTDEKGRDIWVPEYPAIRGDMTIEEQEQVVAEFNERMAALEETGEAVQRKSSLNSFNSFVQVDSENRDQHVVKVMHLGEEYDIIFNTTPRPAQMINGQLRDDDATGFKRLFRGYVRFFSKMNTAFRIKFILGSNLQRDLMFGLTNTFVKENGEFAARYGKNLPVAFSVIPMYIRGEKPEGSDGKLWNLYQQYVESGAPTGYAYMENHHDIDDYVEKRLKEDGISNLEFAKRAKWLLHKLSAAAESVEQIPRFAAFMTAIEMGESVQDAVAKAKDVTLNFNQRGSFKPLTMEEVENLYTRNGILVSDLNPVVAWVIKACVSSGSHLVSISRTLVPFFNPAIQGVDLMMRNAKDHAGKLSAVAASMVTMGYMMAILGGGDDDDDEYSTLSTYTRTHKIVGGGKRNENGRNLGISWAIPQEYVPFYTIGDALARTKLNKQTWHYTIGQIASSFEDAFMPINVGLADAYRDESLSSIGGTFRHNIPIVSTAFDIMLNENYMGMPISRANQYNENLPNWTKGTNQTWDILTELCKAMAGGKESIRPTWYRDWNPAVMQHIIESVGGGAMEDLIRTAIAIEDTWNGKAYIRDRIITGSYIYDYDDQFTRGAIAEQYNYFSAQAEAAGAQYKDAKKKGNAEEMNEIANSKEYMYYRRLTDKPADGGDSYQKMIKKYQEGINELQENKANKSEVKELYKMRDNLREEFNQECLRIYFGESGE